MEAAGMDAMREQYKNALKNMKPIVDVPQRITKNDIGEFTVKIVGDTPLIIHRWHIREPVFQ